MGSDLTAWAQSKADEVEAERAAIVQAAIAPYIELLLRAHDALDTANANEGTEDSLCFWCRAKRYNATVGIVHKPDCIIVELRRALGGRQS